MNTHDQKRRNDVIKALKKAREKAELAGIYLTANNRDPQLVFDNRLVQEHIDIALQHAGLG